jgi:hypothetical protein
MAAKTAVRRLDGLIQVCGPTPENREAWDRYARTIELDRKQFDHMPEDPDDLPGTSNGRSSPTPGATEAVESHDSSPPPQEGRKRSTAPPLHAVPAEVEDAETISMEQQDQATELMGAAGMRASALKRYVADTYGVADIAQLTQAQAGELIIELKKRADPK